MENFHCVRWGLSLNVKAKSLEMAEEFLNKTIIVRNQVGKVIQLHTPSGFGDTAYLDKGVKGFAEALSEDGDKDNSSVQLGKLKSLKSEINTESVFQKEPVYKTEIIKEFRNPETSFSLLKWTEQASVILLQECFMHSIDRINLTGGRVASKWIKVSDSLSEKGYNFTALQCKNRFNIMKRHYLKLKAPVFASYHAHNTSLSQKMVKMFYDYMGEPLGREVKYTADTPLCTSLKYSSSGRSSVSGKKVMLDSRKFTNKECQELLSIKRRRLELEQQKVDILKKISEQLSNLSSKIGLVL